MMQEAITAVLVVGVAAYCAYRLGRIYGRREAMAEVSEILGMVGGMVQHVMESYSGAMGKLEDERKKLAELFDRVPPGAR